MNQIKTILHKAATSPNKVAYFFKTGKGEYAEHDEFIGVTVPTLRKIAKDFAELSFYNLQEMLESRANEERLLALLILVKRYEKAPLDLKEEIYQFYLKNLKHVNNWNLVDLSAHLIIGAHLENSDRAILTKLAESNDLWERRVAIVSTWWFIRKNDLDWTFKIAKQLLNDSHDLIHKATGWMLREAGKKDVVQLEKFLDQYSDKMPRTMLRYSIEKFPEAQRKSYLARPTMINSRAANNIM